MQIKHNTCFGFYIVDFLEENNFIKKINTFNILDSKNILKACLNKPYYNLIPYIERIDFSSCNHYALCLIKAIEEKHEIKPKNNINIIRVILLELENILNKLYGLLNLFKISKDIILINQINIILDAILAYYETISGHRIYHNFHTINGFNQNFSVGNFEKTKNLIQTLDNKLNYLFELAVKIPSIKTKLEFLSNNDAVEIDIRKTDPYFFYKESSIFKIIENNKETGSCAYKRYLAQINSIQKSLLILNTLSKDNVTYDLSDLENNTTLENTFYSSSIQTPRGVLELQFKTDSNNKIFEINVLDPSSQIFKQMIKSLDNIIVDYLNLAINSYYINFMELSK